MKLLLHSYLKMREVEPALDYTVCIRDLDKLVLDMFVWFKISSQFQLMTKRPKNVSLTLKVVKSDKNYLVTSGSV